MTPLDWAGLMRAGLDALARAFPDDPKGDENDRS